MSSRVASSGAAAETAGENIQVVIRVRPRSRKEMDERDPKAITCISKDNEIKVKAGTAHERRFTFDRVFDDSTQRDVFDTVVAPVVDEALAGYSCTVFAYGQTGTGKTFTMEGSKTEDGRLMPDSETAGIITRAVKRVFASLAAGHAEWSVKISFLEIYNEKLDDLLATEPSTFAKGAGAGAGASSSSSSSAAGDGGERLKIVEASERAASKGDRDPSLKGMVKVTNLEELDVRTPDDVFKWVARGIAKRATAETLMNAASSRSHCVFTLTVHTRETTCDGEDLIKIGKLNLVDLAGSESVGRSGAKDARAREAGNINQSLLTLGRVITALVDKLPHVPYRDSKLTRLLQDSLGGKTKTCIIATLSPVLSSLEESLSTLEYANRAKNIRNKPEALAKVSQRQLMSSVNSELESMKAKLAMQLHQHGGIWVSAEQKERDELELASLREELEASAQRRVEKEEELEAVKLSLAETRATLESTVERYNATAAALASTQATLEVTRGELSGERVAHDETRVLVRARAATEAGLTRQAGDLLSTLKASAGDVAGLHGKVGRAAGVLAANKAAGGEYQAQAAGRLASLATASQSFGTAHASTVTGLRDGLASFAQRHAEGASHMAASVAKLRSGFTGYAHAVATSAGALGGEVGRAAGEAASRAGAGMEAINTASADGEASLAALYDHLSASLAAQASALSAWSASALRVLDDSHASLQAHTASHTAALGAIRAQLEASLQDVDGALAAHGGSLAAFEASRNTELRAGADRLLSDIGSMVGAFLAAQTAATTQGVGALAEETMSTRAALGTARIETGARLQTASDEGVAWSSRLASGFTAGRGVNARCLEGTAAAVRQGDGIVADARSAATVCKETVMAAAAATHSAAVVDIDGLRASVAGFVFRERSKAESTSEAAARDCDALSGIVASVGETASSAAAAAASSAADAASAVAGFTGDVQSWVGSESSAVDTFFTSTLREDLPTGGTPSKARTVYPAPVAFIVTSPPGDILNRYRAALAAGSRTPERDLRAFGGRALPASVPLPMASLGCADEAASAVPAKLGRTASAAVMGVYAASSGAEGAGLMRQASFLAAPTSAAASVSQAAVSASAPASLKRTASMASLGSIGGRPRPGSVVEDDGEEDESDDDNIEAGAEADVYDEAGALAPEEDLIGSAAAAQLETNDAADGLLGEEASGACGSPVSEAPSMEESVRDAVAVASAAAPAPRLGGPTPGRARAASRAKSPAPTAAVSSSALSALAMPKTMSSTARVRGVDAGMAAKPASSAPAPKLGSVARPTSLMSRAENAPVPAAAKPRPVAASTNSSATVKRPALASGRPVFPGGK